MNTEIYYYTIGKSNGIYKLTIYDACTTDIVLKPDIENTFDDNHECDDIEDWYENIGRDIIDLNLLTPDEAFLEMI